MRADEPIIIPIGEREYRVTAISKRGGLQASVTIFDSTGAVVASDRLNLDREAARTRFAKHARINVNDVLVVRETIAAQGLAGRSDGFSHARPTGDEPGSVDQTGAAPYVVTPAGLIWRKPTLSGAIEVPLTNFSAEIVADVAEDDGAEERRTFLIATNVNGRRAALRVSANQFGTMTWVTEYLGAGAVVYPGMGTKDHARAAIQLLSQQVAERRIFAHTGFRRVGGQWAYLHRSGAIGPMGPVAGVETSLPGNLTRYDLPDPPTGTDLQAAIRASLRLLELAPTAVTVPLYGTIWRPPLGAADCSLHLAGQTGAGKTELATLAQQHYGNAWSSRDLPASWSSTANAIEQIAFTAKDALVVVDDFAPGGGPTDMQRLHRDADRLFRAQGNRAGRQRLRSDATLRAAKPPRGLIVSTGEDIPRGHSIRARMLILEVQPSDVDWDQLSTCQQDAAAGLYAKALAGYVAWLASRYDEVCEQVRVQVARLRAQACLGVSHRRTPEIVANLMVGLLYFLDFAVDVAAVDRSQAETYRDSWWRTLGAVAAIQEQHHAATEPTRRFVELLAAALASGRAYVAAPNGAAPEHPDSWGWREQVVGAGDYQRKDWRPQGERIGWLDGANLFLEPEASYAVAQDFGRRGGRGPPSIFEDAAQASC